MVEALPATTSIAAEMGAPRSKNWTVPSEGPPSTVAPIVMGVPISGDAGEADSDTPGPGLVNTVKSSSPLVLPLFAASPEYTAFSGCTPAASDEIRSVATPLIRG